MRLLRYALPILLLAVTAIMATGSATASSTAPQCGLDAILRPKCGKVLVGAYVARESGESDSQAVRRYESQAQSRLQIVHFYERGDVLFPSQSEIAALDSGGTRRILLANWKPDIGYTWAQVAAGRNDAALYAEARYLESTYRRTFFLTVHHEPENEVVESPGSGYTAADYRAMYRHVEDVFDAAGVDNVVWVMDYMGFQGWVLKPWFDQLYPGDGYVDWIAYDPYLSKQVGGQDGGWPMLVNNHYGSGYPGFLRWSAGHMPGKPVMLAEWGVQEKAGVPGWKGRILGHTPAALARHPRIKALVYFDNPQADAAGNVAIDTSASALDGYRAYTRAAPVANIG